MPNRCSVCAHPGVDLVNTRLRAFEPPLLPSLAREFGLTRFSLMRHRDHHLVETVAADTQGDVDEPLLESATVEAEPRAAPGPSRRARRRVDRRVRAAQRAVKADAKTTFLETYAETGNFGQAASAAGVGRDRVYRWLEHDEPFKLAFNQAEVEAIEALEAEARERATRGGKLVREVYRGGHLIERVVEYRPSDAVLVKLLQALKPEKYGDKLAVTQTSIVKTMDSAAWDAV